MSSILRYFKIFVRYFAFSYEIQVPEGDNITGEIVLAWRGYPSCKVLKDYIRKYNNNSFKDTDICIRSHHEFKWMQDYLNYIKGCNRTLL